MDGETVERVNRTSKALGGKVSFLWGTITALVQYRNREVNLEIDGINCYHGEATLVVVANGQYFGGGMRIAPEARLDSGHFDIIIASGLTKPEVIANLPRIYRGTHLSHPKVYAMQGTHVKASSNQKVLFRCRRRATWSLGCGIHIAPAQVTIDLLGLTGYFGIWGLWLASCYTSKTLHK